jgi:hypothetical protein
MQRSPPARRSVVHQFVRADHELAAIKIHSEASPPVLLRVHLGRLVRPAWQAESDPDRERTLYGLEARTSGDPCFRRGPCQGLLCREGRFQRGPRPYGQRRDPLRTTHTSRVGLFHRTGNGAPRHASGLGTGYAAARTSMPPGPSCSSAGWRCPTSRCFPGDRSSSSPIPTATGGQCRSSPSAAEAGRFRSAGDSDNDSGAQVRPTERHPPIGRIPGAPKAATSGSSTGSPPADRYTWGSGTGTRRRGLSELSARDRWERGLDRQCSKTRRSS